MLRGFSWLTIGMLSVSLAMTQALAANTESVTALQQQALSMNTELLAPLAHARAEKSYTAMQALIEKGRAVSTLQKQIQKAEQQWQAAIALTTTAQTTFDQPLKSRADALQAEAETYAVKTWQQAEKTLRDAAVQLEKNDTADAETLASKADEQYRGAELEAIKANYLAETRMLLNQADKLKARRYAPKTLAAAQALLSRAEQELNQNRYDTDLPRSLARQAKAEVQHALFLTQRVKAIKAGDQSIEDLILEYEQPIIRIAGSADIVARLESGFEQTTDDILAYIDRLQFDKMKLDEEVYDLETRLSSVTSEQRLLQQKIRARQAYSQKLDTIDQLFERHEASVLRRGKELVISLVGLEFDSGQSVIKADNASLLSKVKQAIQTFPDAKMIVEGHTDSYGSDQTNLELSKRRAEVISEYLKDSLSLSDSQIAFLGYGETKPVANNETREGRAKNRRIDIVLRPKT